MPKKIRLFFVFALVALVSGVYAQKAELDIIYRDFPVTAPGFEEFMACDDAGNSNSTSIRFNGDRYTTDGNGTELKYGTCNNGTASGKRGYHNGPDALQGCNGWEWGNPIKVTLGMIGQRLYYDKDNCPKEDIMEDPDGKNREEIIYRYCTRPVPGNDNCSSISNPGNKIVQWFSRGGDAREVRDIIELTWQNSSSKYVIEYNANTSHSWNKDGNDNGFFPLDKYDDDGSGKTWGRQSINEWCGHDNGTKGFNRDRNDICRAWGDAKSSDAGRNAAANRNIKNKLHNYGFSAAGSGAFKYDENANDVFKFIGDDDMWIFIDGNLAADLGGVHLAAPATIYIKEYAQKTGPWSNRPGEVWQTNSSHVVNFFYMDRNTDGSNFKLEMSLSGLVPPRFGAPRILKAETTQKQDGTSSTIIYVSSKLDDESIRQFLNTINADEFPIVINKAGDKNLYGFKIESISDATNMGSEGYAYTVTGKVCKSKTECGGTLIINSGDSLTFNVLFDELISFGKSVFTGLALPREDLYIRTSGSKTPATKISWAINTTDLPPIDFKPNVPDKTPVKPPFIIADGGGSLSDQGDKTVPGGAGGSVGWYEGGGKFPNITQVWDVSANGGAGGMVPIGTVPGAGSGNSDVHGFGTVGKQIPTQRAGELILTVFPSTTNAGAYKEWLENEEKQKLFGLPPKMAGDPNNPESGAWWGLADPSKEADYGGYQFVKNGFPNESSTKGNIKIAPTRCTTLFDEKGEPRINCLNFSLVAKQPFQIAVTVYDQLGNFVTQYRETLSEQEFRNVVQAPNYISGNVNSNNIPGECELPTPNNYGAPTTLTTNGLINVNVNIYPFSSEGRRFGNGVYIVKIDRVDLPFKEGKKINGNGHTCVSVEGGNPTSINPSFVRYHADQKFGWMRTTSK